MVATGGSAAMAIELGGAQEVRLPSIEAAPEGVFTAALGCLNDRKYILPARLPVLTASPSPAQYRAGDGDVVRSEAG